jgi:hypothetical protein
MPPCLPPEASAPPGFELDVAADQAIAACGGDAREAVKALIVANGFLESQVDELRAAVSIPSALAVQRPTSVAAPITP